MVDSSVNRDYEVIQRVVTAKLTLSWLKGSVLKIQGKEGVHIDLEDAREISRLKQLWSEGKPHGVMLVSPQLGNVSREVRDYLAREESSRNTVCRAIVASNMGMRLLTSLFMSVNKPKIPHKVFSNEADALVWLTSNLNAFNSLLKKK